MKLRLSLAALWLIALAACGSPQPTAPTSAPVASTIPATQSTSMPPTQPPLTVMPPTTTSAPAPTQPPATPTDTAAPHPTDTATATPAAKPRPTSTSAGPLSAAIYVANCRSAPTVDKPGGVIIQISVEATGGNGEYGYLYQNKNYSTKFIDVVGEKGTRSIGEVLITSGNQQIRKEFDISPADLTCP